MYDSSARGTWEWIIMTHSCKKQRNEKYVGAVTHEIINWKLQSYVFKNKIIQARLRDDNFVLTSNLVERSNEHIAGNETRVPLRLLLRSHLTFLETYVSYWFNEYTRGSRDSSLGKFLTWLTGSTSTSSSLFAVR